MPRTCFAHLADADIEAVAAAHEAGEGARIAVSLGGKTDALHGAPLQVDAEVVMNTQCRFVASTPMGKGGSTIMVQGSPGPAGSG